MNRRTLVVLAALVLMAGCAAPPSSSWTASIPTTTDRVAPALVDEATWARLAAHPLRLPPPTAGAACPVTPAVPLNSFVGPLAGSGPVYVTENRMYYSPAPDGSIFAKVAWIARPDYTGPALIRGARIDAPGEISFVRGSGPRQSELHFEYDTGVRSAGSEEGWRFLPSLVLIRGAGCYAFQIDGLDWTTTVVMDAMPNP